MQENREVARALDEVARSVEAREPERAWKAIERFGQHIDADQELALTWLTLLRITPSRPQLFEEARRILASWPTTPGIVLAACDALVRAAELQASDEPPAVDGPAQTAASAAERCLLSLDANVRRDPKVGGYLAMSRANALRLAHRHDEALASCTEALVLQPDNGDFWFNLGLVHKARRSWNEALEANQRARGLLGDRKGVLWNLAIAATALGRGDIAAEAFRSFGLPAEVAPSGMPYVEGLPPVQVRAATRGSGHGSAGAELDAAISFELVWVSPLTPCHGVVQSATFRQAAVDYGDLVLWDGTPVGVVEHEGKLVPRFPLLAVLRKGDERRLRFVALEQDAGDVEAFGAALPNGAVLFVHRAKVEQLCARCASGEHMRKHEHTRPEPHRLVYGKIVVSGQVDLAAFRVALEAHVKSHPKVQVVMPELLEAVGDTQAAGKAHQMWRGLERSALKSAPTDPALQA